MQQAPDLQLLALIVRNRHAGGTRWLPCSHQVRRCALGEQEGSDLQHSGACSRPSMAALQLRVGRCAPGKQAASDLQYGGAQRLLGARQVMVHAASQYLDVLGPQLLSLAGVVHRLEQLMSPAATGWSGCEHC